MCTQRNFEGTTPSVEKNLRNQKSTPPPKRSERERTNQPIFTSFRVAIERESNDLEKIPHRCCKLHSTPVAVLRRRCYGVNDSKTAVTTLRLASPLASPPSFRRHKLSQVCLARSLVGLRCNHRRPSFEQVTRLRLHSHCPVLPSPCLLYTSPSPRD